MPTTVVTGASRGIGATICAYLSARGHKVIGIARSPIENFDGSFYLADLADADAAAEVLARVVAENHIDNLVNNAGCASREALEEIDLAAMRQMMALNVEATVQVTQAVLPQMRARGKGRVVNMASRAMRGRERTSAYAASKAAVEALTRSWAIEFAACGITVNAVAPGIISSEMFVRNNPPDSPETRKLLERVPMHRPGEPAEVAAAIAYFLSDDAAYTTGQTLYVCGGWSI